MRLPLFLSRWLVQSDYWRDVSWMALGTAVAQAISLASMPLLTRLYAPDAFAALSVFTQATALMAVVISWRFEYAVPLPRRAVDASAVVVLVVSLCGLGAVAWSGIATQLPSHFMDRAAVVPQALWWLVPITAALLSISVALQHATQRRRDYRRAGLAEIGSKLAYFATAMLGLYLLPPPYGLLLAVVVGSVAKIVQLLGPRTAKAPRICIKRLRTWLRLVKDNARRYRGLSGSMVGSHLMLTFTGLIPILYLAMTYGTDALGQWSLVQSTTYLPSALVGAAIGQVYYQRAAQARAEKRDFFDLWQATARRLAFAGVPCFVGLAAVSPWLYPFVFGAQWELAGKLASIQCLSAFLAFLTTPLDRTCIVVGVWRYIPTWHFSRLVTTVAVVALAQLFDWSLYGFIGALTAQSSALYLVDFLVQRHFARSAFVALR